MSPAEKVNSMLETAGGRPQTRAAHPDRDVRIGLVAGFAARWWTPAQKRQAQLDQVFPGRFDACGRALGIRRNTPARRAAAAVIDEAIMHAQIHGEIEPIPAAPAL